MKCTMKLGTVILLFWGVFAFAQVSSSTEIDMGGGLEVLTDIQGVDFSLYLQQVRYNVKRNWHVVIPSSAMPPLLKKGKVSIEFTIFKDGRLGELRYVSNSGDVAMDRAAYGGITGSAPFLPLPPEFPGQFLRLRMTFLYNPALSGISPSHVQVRAGSSLLFSPVLKGFTPITWSVVGRGCAGSACGTISDSGLYTAPKTLPENPTITVEAKAQADLGERVSAVVTILPPDSAP